MVHTWDKDLKTPRPVEKEPITVGSADNSAEVMPHPIASDPAGTCSRFYGHADWPAAEPSVTAGWQCAPTGGQRHSFDWQGVLAGRPDARADVGGDGRTSPHGAGARPRAVRAETADPSRR